MHLSITDVYDAFTNSLNNRLDRRVNDEVFFSWGIKLQHIKVTDSINNGKYLLLNFPLYYQFSTANHLLNPTKGFTLAYRLNPYINLSSHNTYLL